MEAKENKIMNPKNIAISISLCPKLSKNSSRIKITNAQIYVTLPIPKICAASEFLVALRREIFQTSSKATGIRKNRSIMKCR